MIPTEVFCENKSHQIHFRPGLRSTPCWGGFRPTTLTRLEERAAPMSIYGCSNLAAIQNECST